MALFSNKKGIREAKEAAGAVQYAGASSLEAVDAAKATLLSAELGKLGVFGMLGAPGSYDTPVPGQWQPPGFDIFDTSGTGLSQPNQDLKQSMPYSTGKEGLLGTPRQGIIDPAKYTQNIMNSAQFRIQSLRTAEAEQMLRGEGVEFDKLYNSTLGLVNQQYAQMQREAARGLKDQFARSSSGGSGGKGARNIALENARRDTVNENILRDKANAMWTASLANFKYIRELADKTQTNNQAFMENLPFANKSFLDAIQKTAELRVTASGQAALIAQRGYEVKQSQQPVNFGEKLLEGVIKMAVSPIMGGADGLLGGGGGGIMGMIGGVGNIGFGEGANINAVSDYATDYLHRNEPVQGPETPWGDKPTSNVSGWGGLTGATERGLDITGQAAGSAWGSLKSLFGS